MSEVFGENYAGIYDALYGAKDYAGEADLIEKLLKRHGTGTRRVLDLGCGTGNHAFPLAKRGYTLVGVDRSSAMLDQARTKAVVETAQGAPIPEFIHGDLCRIDLGERFDAVLMMFTVLGYQCEDADLAASLQAVRRHLEPGGLFIFDVWNGPAVLAQGLEDRVARAMQGSAKITRKTRAWLEAGKNICHVRFDIERQDGQGEPFTWQEDHIVRYFFPDELARLLKNADLRLLDLKRFPDGEGPADEGAWNVIGIARAGMEAAA